MSPINRRELLVGTAALAAARPLAGEAPAVVVPKPGPVVVASANGHKFRNGGPRTAVEEAFAQLLAGEDPVQAAVAGVRINELDPTDESVGFGGLPNADGVVQLDSACMDGKRKRAGGVAALEGVRTPAAVALAVLRETDHHLLVGEGAQRFARQIGMLVEPELTTESSRRKWIEWKRKIDPEHWLDPARREAAAEAARAAMIVEGRVDPDHAFGTIHLSALSPQGDLGCVTTTSGLAWKIPGRVGDSPILGAGLYLDNEVGSAGSTGRGEANLYNLSSFFIVEEMRRGKHPKDAALAALSRIRAATIEKRLLDAKGQPKFNVSFYVVDRSGRTAGATMFHQVGSGVAQWAVCNEHGAELRETEALFEAMAPG